MAAGLIKTPVIVLHRYAYSESSYVVKALSPDAGVVSFMVKGARRKDSPYRVALDPLALAEVVYRPSTRSELHLPREAVLLRYHHHLRADLERLAMGHAMAETLLRLGAFGGHFQEEHALLQESLAWLDGDTPLASSLFAGHSLTFAFALFLWRLTDSLGIGFRLDECVHCQTPFDGPPADLWPALGGGVCANCLGTRRPGWAPDFLLQIHDFAYSGICSGDPMRIEHFLALFLKIHAGGSLELRSHAWLDQLRGGVEISQGDPQ